MTMTPDEWLADFEAKVADMQRKATAFRRTIEQAGETVSSEDGKLTVTVAPNGALLDLKIDDTAVSGSGAALAASIITLVRTAREGAATHVADSFRPLVGSHVEDLDTAATVAEPAASATAAAADEDDDFDDKSIFE